MGKPLWYKYPLDNFVAYVGSKRKLSSLSASDVDVWIAKNWMKTRTGKPMSANAIKQPKRAVKNCFEWLAGAGNKIGINPFKGIKVGDYTGT